VAGEERAFANLRAMRLRCWDTDAVDGCPLIDFRRLVREGLIPIRKVACSCVGVAAGLVLAVFCAATVAGFVNWCGFDGGSRGRLWVIGAGGHSDDEERCCASREG